MICVSIIWQNLRFDFIFRVIKLSNVALSIMEKLNEYLQALLSTCSYELHIEPNKTPYIVSDNGITEVANSPLLGTQISTLIFPLIPPSIRQELPHKPEIEFVHNHNLVNFNFNVKKSPAGFVVTIQPLMDTSIHLSAERQRQL